MKASAKSLRKTASRRKSRTSWLLSGINRLLHWPRMIRVAISGLFALAVTLAVALVAFYESIFYSGGLQILLYCVAAGLGLVMYLVGWYLIVGTVDTTPAARRATWWYLIVGILAVALVVLWLIQAGTMGAEAV